MELEKADSRRLIELAYDPAFTRRCGLMLVKTLTDHLQRVQNADGKVQDWVDPETNIEFASQLMDSSPSLDSESLVEQFRAMIEICLARGQNLNHPHCVGHQVPAPLPLTGLFDAVTTMTNQVQGVYEMGPWSVAAERAVIEKVGAAVGFSPGQFGGIVTSGGSLGNLTALLAARSQVCPMLWRRGHAEQDQSPVLVVQADAHYCVDRAAGVMGIGTDHVIRVSMDESRRMDVGKLDGILADLKQRGVPVIAVVAVASTTPVGAFDPLDAVADVCEKHRVWMHVDAAHGGAVCFSQKHRHLVKGLDRADSVVFDAHKMMFLPAVCALVFYKRRKDRFAAFQQSAPYLFDPSAPDLSEYDNGMVTFECTKRAAAIGLWGVLSMFGTELFEQLVDHVIEMGKTLHRLLSVDPRFETFAKPEANIVVFRYLPHDWQESNDDYLNRLQLQLRRHLLETGRVYLSQTKLNERIYLRSTLMNPLTQKLHLEQILTEVKRGGVQTVAKLREVAEAEQSDRAPKSIKESENSHFVTRATR